MNREARAPRTRLGPIRLGAVLAVAVAVAFVVWVVVRNNGGSSPTTTAATQSNTTATARSTGIGPIAADPARLRALSVELGHPIYWAGPKRRTTYELTRTSNGRVFIRYLPRGTAVGVRKAFTIVGTYPVANASRVLIELAKKSGERRLSAPGGGVAVYNVAQPTNVYVAFPSSNLQIEVFDPSPRRARRLVTSGQVAPVR